MIYQKTEKDISSVHLGENCKTRYIVYYRIIFFFGLLDHCVLLLLFCLIFVINCSSLLCTKGHLFSTTVSLLNYAREKFPISAALQSRVLLDFSSIFFITFCQSINKC